MPIKTVPVLVEGDTVNHVVDGSDNLDRDIDKNDDEHEQYYLYC